VTVPDGSLHRQSDAGPRYVWLARSILIFAAQAHAPGVCEALLLAGALVDAVDSNGNTPLVGAVFTSRGRDEVVLGLRQYGADPFRIREKLLVAGDGAPSHSNTWS